MRLRRRAIQIYVYSEPFIPLVNGSISDLTTASQTTCQSATASNRPGLILAYDTFLLHVTPNFVIHSVQIQTV